MLELLAMPLLLLWLAAAYLWAEDAARPGQGVSLTMMNGPFPVSDGILPPR